MQRPHPFSDIILLALLFCVGFTLEAQAHEFSTDDDPIQLYAPGIISRESWGARESLPGMNEQVPSGIIIHHTGVKSNPKIAIEAKMRNLQMFSQTERHRSRGNDKSVWPDVPYHFYIGVLGNIAAGRDPKFAGDTNTNYDTLGFIQIVVEGDFEKEKPASAQIASLERLLTWVMLNWNLQPESVSMHKDHAPTDCPGRNLIFAVPGIVERAAAMRASAISTLCKSGTTNAMLESVCHRK